MKKLIIALCLLVGVSAQAQIKKTTLTLLTRDGKAKPIYRTSKGRFFIFKINKKGKRYRFYLVDSK